MPEILARTFLPIAPVAADEVARKADAGSYFTADDTTPPVYRHVGMIWAFPSAGDPDIAEAHVWSGTQWLPIGGGAPVTPSAGDWDSGSTWDGGETWQ